MSHGPKLTGAANFRDLGGHATRSGRWVARGRAFRSDGLQRITAADVAVLEGLQIDRVFDLRTEGEVERDGIGSFASVGDRHVHVPLVAVTLSPFDPDLDWSQIDLQDRYLQMLREGGSAIARIFVALAEPGARPLVFHCTGGKDRTGVVAALILRALGVADDAIVDDYAVSQRRLAGLTDAYRDELLARGLDQAAIAYLTSSPPARMRRTLAELDRLWGSTETYLEAIGVDSAVVDALRSNLLA
jgi:protein-tyrosine phosphatase